MCTHAFASLWVYVLLCVYILRQSLRNRIFLLTTAAPSGQNKSIKWDKYLPDSARQKPALQPWQNPIGKIPCYCWATSYGDDSNLSEPSDLLWMSYSWFRHQALAKTRLNSMLFSACIFSSPPLPVSHSLHPSCTQSVVSQSHLAPYISSYLNTLWQL